MVNVVVDFVQSAGVFYIATSENDKPNIRPMMYIENIDNKAYIVMSKKEGLYKELQNNNKIAITTAMIEDKWIRIFANVEFDESESTIQKIYDSNTQIEKIYSKDVIALACMKDAKAVLQSLSSPSEEYSF